MKMGSRLEKKSDEVRKRIEGHTFENEEGDEYEGSKFGGFPDYFRRKKIKLQNLDTELRSQSDKPKIFKGIVAQVNGYTQPSLNDLHHMIVEYGGGFMQYLDGKTTVTHIIAANLTPKKAVEFRRYRIVKPAWVVDSVKAGKLLPWENYRVLDEGVGQRLLGFDNGKVVSQNSIQQRGYREQTNSSWYTTQVKNVAEEIDDDHGAPFPSTQFTTYNGTGQYTGQASPIPQAEPIDDEFDLEGDTFSRSDLDLPAIMHDNMENSLSQDYETTSSLEDALVSATTDDGIHEAKTAYSGCPGDTIVQPAHINASLSGVQTLLNNRKRSGSSEVHFPSKKNKDMTAEEHNLLLLSDPHVRKSSTANPDFIRQYYSESRLHHLSTWKADLKARLQQMAADKSASQQSLTKRKPGSRRYILHVDFDSFFCAVSLKTAPQYVDKPAVVAHGSGPGSEIASCNYPARAFGVKNGMWMKHALKLCPDLKVLPYDFPAYEEASRGFYDAILSVGGIVQSVSIDEALLDATTLVLSSCGTDDHGIQEGCIWREQEKADEIAQGLRDSIKLKTGCAVSVGIGGNILLAKVALRKAKPAGQHQIKPEDVLDFIGELAVQDLPGVAYSIGGRLEEIGIKFVKDIRNITKERLINVLGPKTGEKIWDYSRGIDRTEVGVQVVRKSVSAEVNWGIRFISQPEAEEFVQNLCGELNRRLVEQRVKGRQLTMKIMRRAADAPMDPPKNLGHGKCDVFNKSIVLGVATNSPEIIGREAVSILRGYGFSPGELRGLGVQMQKLEPIKGTGTGHLDGSQKRIAFKTSVHSPLPRKEVNNQFQDDIIDDAENPRKQSLAVHPAQAIAIANATDGIPNKRPLNLQGTQFILPTQVDRSILEELPQDIRSKLMAQSKKGSAKTEPPDASRSGSFTPIMNPPLPSQLDPEVFAALPDDMKAEVLASYPSKLGSSQGQSLLPQSPRKSRIIKLPKRPLTPTRKRPGPLFHEHNKGDSTSTLTQSNFLSAKRAADDRDKDNPFDSDSNMSNVPDEISQDFLDALPEEIRTEVIAQHRRDRLARHSGLNLSERPSKKTKNEHSEGVQRKLRLPPRDPKPTFTTQGLSGLSELRTTLSRWYREFKEDGPHPDDVSAMERYLRRVVLEERNMAKAEAMVKWLIWLVGEEGGKAVRAWEKAVDMIKVKVNEAVKERGLGVLEF